ncbi:uracil-DNA glycosylase family protein [Plastorhodobacter daqingensis]|uniref:Type-4 uracil-DNA glycosylase n=1 Tax=Plastorhodobacter daqingensis TaxID=1387281 RepID=A0ABW2UQ72_9RHOB
MESALDFFTAKALLEWQIDLGATEAILDAPVNRYDVGARSPAPHVPGPTAIAGGPAEPMPAAPDPVALARRLAAAAPDLGALAEAQQDFDLCELKKGARSFVFADGTPGARVMILGEAPGRDEDLQGRPFVGRAGQLLDRMLAAIGLARAAPDPDRAVYISNILPWRPPQNRKPEASEIAMMLPFVERHVELAAPEILVLMGNTPCGALLGREAISRIRGTWTEALGRPVLPMFHPAYLLRTPQAKRDAWADLLALQARLRET